MKETLTKLQKAIETIYGFADYAVGAEFLKREDATNIGQALSDLEDVEEVLTKIVENSEKKKSSSVAPDLNESTSFIIKLITDGLKDM